MLERFTQEQPPATPLAPSAGSIDVNMDLSGALHAVLPNSRTVVLQGQAHAGFRTHPSWWQLRSSSSYGYNVGDALGRECRGMVPCRRTAIAIHWQPSRVRMSRVHAVGHVSGRPGERSGRWRWQGGQP